MSAFRAWVRSWWWKTYDVDDPRFDLDDDVRRMLEHF